MGLAYPAGNPHDTGSLVSLARRRYLALAGLGQPGSAADRDLALLVAAEAENSALNDSLLA